MEEGCRRRYQRLSTHGGPYEVRFRFADRPVADVRLLNLSACGCGLEIQIGEAQDLEVGSALGDLYVDHPGLPYVPMEGRVVRLLGKVPGKTAGYVIAGLDFTELTELVQDLIDAHVNDELA